jgi:hypothetical protein
VRRLFALGASSLISLNALASGSPSYIEEAENARVARSISRAAVSLKAAFYRKAASLDANGYRPDLTVNSTLFPQWGFEPSGLGPLTWSAVARSASVLRVCVHRTVSNSAQWNVALGTLLKEGLTPTASDCLTPTLPPYAPSAFPAVIHGRIDLDAETAPVETTIPPEIGVTNINVGAKALPGLTVSSSATGVGSKSFSITNYQPSALVLVSAQVREGFTISHDCDVIPAYMSCVVSIQYAGAHGDKYPGYLRLSFSTGIWAGVGLLGTVTP